MSRTSAEHLKQWQELSDEEILRIRVKDLRLQIQGSAVEPLVERLYAELDARGIRFHPPCYLADEWLCPDRIPIIGIPFWLAHPRLRAIEQKMMFEVEGGKPAECMKLLRHECGHAMNYAYELFKRTRWRELFGPFSTDYSNTYRFQPYSRRYVMHLQGCYAQSHPDEDFAETFAVWLSPESNWQQKYRYWPAMVKLRYVDGLMQRIAGAAPINTARQPPPWSASRMTSTLAAYYERRRKALGDAFLGYYDESLKGIFSTGPAKAPAVKASKVLRRHRRLIVEHATRCTGHRKYDIMELLGRLIGRCDALDLYATDGEPANIIGITALVTAIAGKTLRLTR